MLVDILQQPSGDIFHFIFDIFVASSSAWLNQDDDYTVWKAMNDRIEAYTGLDMLHTEELQVTLPRNFKNSVLIIAQFRAK